MALAHKSPYIFFFFLRATVSQGYARIKACILFRQLGRNILIIKETALGGVARMRPALHYTSESGTCFGRAHVKKDCCAVFEFPGAPIFGDRYHDRGKTSTAKPRYDSRGAVKDCHHYTVLRRLKPVALGQKRPPRKVAPANSFRRPRSMADAFLHRGPFVFQKHS